LSLASLNLSCELSKHLTDKFVNNFYFAFFISTVAIDNLSTHAETTNPKSKGKQNIYKASKHSITYITLPLNLTLTLNLNLNLNLILIPTLTLTLTLNLNLNLNLNHLFLIPTMTLTLAQKITMCSYSSTFVLHQILFFPQLSYITNTTIDNLLSLTQFHMFHQDKYPKMAILIRL